MTPEWSAIHSSLTRQSVNKRYLCLNHPSRGGRVDIMFLLPAEGLFHLSLEVSSLHWVLKDACQWERVRDQEPRRLIPDEAETNWHQWAAEIVTSCKTRGHDLRLKAVVAERQLSLSLYKEKFKYRAKQRETVKYTMGAMNWGEEKKAYFINGIIIRGKTVNFVQIRVKPQNNRGD